MIPVRVPAGMAVTLANERRFAPAAEGHWLHGQPCPVCDEPLGQGTTVLVFAGILPEDRKPGGWTTGAAVAVHETCALPPEAVTG
jgi:hypothetical protein